MAVTFSGSTLFSESWFDGVCLYTAPKIMWEILIFNMNSDRT